MKPFSLAIVLCSVLLFAIPVFAQDAPPDAGLTSNPVYKKNCAKCHGKTAGGRMMGGPSLTSDKAANMSADDMRNLITNGKGHMPKFTGKLMPDEIDMLVQQISAMNKK